MIPISSSNSSNGSSHEAYPPATLLEYLGDLAAQSAGEHNEGTLPKRPCRFTEALPLL